MTKLKYGIFLGLIGWMMLIVFAFNLSIFAGILATISPIVLMALLAK